MKVYGELLIFFLLLFTNGRVLFVRHEKRDALVMLAPLAFILVVLQIFAWGLDIYNLYGLFVSIVVLLTNFHALFRYSESLYVDHYSGLMKFWAIITSILSLFGIALLIYFFPVEYSDKKLGITETKQYYEGSFQTRFTEKKLFSKPNVIITTFSPEQTADTEDLEPKITVQNQKILFIPDKRADTENYKPYLQLLANNGYTIYSADFYTDEVKASFNTKSTRRFLQIFQSLLDYQSYKENINLLTYNTTLETQAVISILENEYGINEPLYIITDEMSFKGAQAFAVQHKEKVKLLFSLCDIDEYKTHGYGFICQSNPFLAGIFEQNRDSKGEITFAVVKKTIEKIQSVEQEN